MNVLAIQLKRIGDLVLTAPALRAMRTGGARVTLAVHEGTAALLPALVGFSVDEALVYRTAGGNFSLWRRLARGGWDTSVDFTGRDRSALMTGLAHATRRVIARPALRKGGWRRWVYNAVVDSSVRERHTVDHYLDHLQGIGMSAAADGPALHLPAEHVVRADAALVDAGIDGPFAVVHPGSARAEKYWVPERWAEIIRHLARERGLPCVLTGGKGDPFEDAHLAQIRTALAADADLCADFAGRLDLLTLAATLSRAAMCVSVDSGPMHLAAAFRRPQIALFGPTNPFHWQPRHPQAVVLRAGDGDRQLQKSGASAAGAPTADISTRAVIDAIEHLPL